ncbi:MAG: type II toxin-antitoxin system RelE/ParE family toxin [Acidobacteria bacterium]|nr:type II toxin-antitoxin system RelE/ParE family toxin [Acidobacteriota bacterium]
MTLRWTAEAARDLERIANYLFDHAPDRAEDLVNRIYNAPADLLTFPHRGRPGKKRGTRELVLVPLPYLVVYRIADETIQILRILHGAQRWP